MTLNPDDITLAARAMTNVDPPSDLEARIKRRLDAQTQTRPTAGRWPIIAGFATVTAMVIIAVTLRSPEVPESRGPDVSESRGPDVPKSRIASVVVAPVPERAEPRDLGTSGRRDLGTSMEAELAWRSRRIPALEVIDPLSVDRMTFESIQPEAILITPLTITPLVTSPVHGDPDAGRQHFD